jgi:hypothetical protein
MAIAFPRSLRALGNDRFRPSTVTLALTCLVLFAWFGWFFLSQIPMLESSTNFKAGRNGSVTATFPAATLARFKAGQPATLQLNVPDQTGTLYNGQVLRVQNASQTANSTIELYFPQLAQVPTNAQGTIQVQVETLTPATLVLQALRQSAASLNSAPPSSKTATPIP